MKKLNKVQKEMLYGVWAVPTIAMLFIFPMVGLAMFLVYIPDMITSFKNLK